MSRDEGKRPKYDDDIRNNNKRTLSIGPDDQKPLIMRLTFYVNDDFFKSSHQKVLPDCSSQSPLQHFLGVFGRRRDNNHDKKLMTSLLCAKKKANIIFRPLYKWMLINQFKFSCISALMYVGRYLQTCKIIQKDLLLQLLCSTILCRVLLLDV